MTAQEDDTLVRPPENAAAGASEPFPSNDAPVQVHGDVPDAERRSLFDDLAALFEDTKTYFDAELSYQKSRAGFVGNRLKMGIAFGAVGAFFAVLAAIGLTVGLIIALTPIITAWGATALVVVVWLLVAYLLLRKAGAAFGEMSAAMALEKQEDADG